MTARPAPLTMSEEQYAELCESIVKWERKTGPWPVEREAHAMMRECVAAHEQLARVKSDMAQLNEWVVRRGSELDAARAELAAVTLDNERLREAIKRALAPLSGDAMPAEILRAALSPTQPTKDKP